MKADVALPVSLSILPRRQGMSRDEDAGAARNATAELVLEEPSPSTTPSQEAKAISSTPPRPTILLAQHQRE